MKKIIFISMSFLFLLSCATKAVKSAAATKTVKPAVTVTNEGFKYSVDQFEDVEILRYYVPDFDSLTIQQKSLVYYLSQAAIEGRDILYDQNGKHNLCVRRTLEAVFIHYVGDRKTDEFVGLNTYLKQVWMGNGIHHHYSSDKFTPKFTQAYFADVVRSIDSKELPLEENETVESLIEKLSPIIFDASLMPKRVNQAEGQDLILTSANNYYEGVTQKEVENFYEKMKDANDPTPVAYGLNSKLVKVNGIVKEETYKLGGLYSAAIEKIIFWLQKALTVAETEQQKLVISSLIKFYETGDLKVYDEYSINWVKELDAQVDFINGFTESYGDPLGMKASWEALVNFKNLEATKRTEIISRNAQWFEDNSPIAKEHKKEKVKGVSAKVITAAMLGGDCYPATPIGINLPNSNWIRRDYGSKSVTIENITEAYEQASLGSGFGEEFMWSDEERELSKKYGSLTGNLHTDLHECLGHASGKLLPGVDQDALKAYGSAIEEGRADLFALYYMGDDKMVELGLLPNDEAYKAEYYKYIMNGLMTQLTRINPGANIEESHMRNRQLIAAWAFEKGKADNVIEIAVRDNKRYIRINDYKKLRDLFGQLLVEIQRVKSTGDFEGARHLIETYAVKVDPSVHAEVLERYKSLDLRPYRGFVNPVYTAVTDEKGSIIDVSLSYDEDYVNQHLRYSREYSNLPTYN